MTPDLSIPSLTVAKFDDGASALFDRLISECHRAGIEVNPLPDLLVGRTRTQVLELVTSSVDSPLVICYSKAANPAFLFEGLVHRSQARPTFLVTSDGENGPLLQSIDGWMSALDVEGFNFESLFEMINRSIEGRAHIRTSKTHIPEIGPLFGRNDELDSLDFALSNKKNAAIVVGEPGMGKSALLAASAVRAQRSFQEIFWLEGRRSKHDGILERLTNMLDVSIEEATSEVIEAEVARRLERVRTLVVIDDATHEIVELLFRIRNLQSHRQTTFLFSVLVTDWWVGEYFEKSEILHLGCLSAASTAQWFEHYANKTSPLSRADLAALIAVSHGHPFTVRFFVGLLQENWPLLKIVSGFEGRLGWPHGAYRVAKVFSKSLTAAERQVLWAFVKKRDEMTVGELKSLTPNIADSQLSLITARFVSLGILEKDAIWFSMPNVVLEFLSRPKVRHWQFAAEDRDRTKFGSGTLYVTFDPVLVPKEEIVEWLQTLNSLYIELGGDELLIREDEVGRFADARVCV